MQDLAEITEAFCTKNDVPIQETPLFEDISLPRYRGASVILVPLDIVRDLPIANDWSDIETAAMENEEIRRRVNSFLGGIAKPTVAERKAALRSAALGSAADFAHFLSSVKENSSSYDPKVDELAYFKLRDILLSDLSQFRNENTPDISKGPETLRDFVLETVDHFRHHVENGNLWEELWYGSKPKKERAAQLIYFAIADCFCKANNVDVSPEANMGGGPVDFKFSQGYNARVLVEVKRSTGTVKHGYEKQLEIYKNASRTNYGIFVVMDYGGMGNKLRDIQRIRRAGAGHPHSNR